MENITLHAIENSTKKDNLPSRIFKALFCIGEPLHGFLLASGIILMILPVVYCLALSNLLFQGFVQRITYAMGFALVMLVYFLILTSHAIFNLFKPSIKNKAACAICSVACALLLPVTGYFILGWHFIRKRHFLSLALLSGAFILAILNFFHLLPYSCHSLDNSFMLSICIYGLAAAAILIATRCRPLHLTAIAAVPYIVAIAAMLILLLQYQGYKQHNKSLRKEISKILGFSLEQEDYQKRISSGMKPDQEPLASFLKEDSFKEPDMLKDVTTYDVIPSFEQEKLRQLSTELDEKYSGYERIILEFTAVTPQKVAHKHDWANESAASILLPELGKLRRATRFLALQMHAAPQNRELAMRNNASMIAIRDWALNDDILISFLVGIAIESTRLHALCSTLPYIKYTDAEWEQLLGKAPDWNISLANSYGCEASFYENVKDYCLKYAWKNARGLKKNSGDDILELPRFVPMNICTLLFEKDNSYALEGYKRLIEISLKTPHNYKELEQMTESSAKTAKKDMLILSAMLLPAVDKVIMKTDTINDLRRIANLARLVIEHDRKNGALPASLDLISDDCKDSISCNPFLFETKDIEVHGFKISAQYDKTRSFLGSPKNFILIPYKKEK